MINRIQELDLIDRVPEKLWTKVPDIVQEAIGRTDAEAESNTKN